MAALVLASAPIMIAESKLATTDAVLMLTITLGFSALWELEQRESKRWAVIFWVALALGVLTKGPVGPAMILAAGLTSWVAGGPRSCWFRLRPKLGLLLFLALVLPWYVAISVVTRGEFLKFALGEQVLTRMTTELETHGGFPGYYLVSTLFSFYPWSCLLPAALLAAWFRRRSGRNVGFLIGWIVGPLILLECVRTKLLHYYLPSIAGCSLLVAWVVFQVSDAGVNLRRWPLGRLAVGLIAGLGAAMAVGLTAAGFVAEGAPRWALLAMGMVLVSGTLVAIGRIHAGRTIPAAHALVATWCLTMLAFGGWLLPAIEPYRLTPLVAEKLETLVKTEKATPLLANFRPPGVIFDMGHPVGPLRDRLELYRNIKEGGAVVSALDDGELKLVRKAPELKVEVRERVQGFDVETARQTELTLVVIRASGLPPPIVRRTGGQETLVK
ncbi:MAG TPA: phospholipid carrier-dependent glycosyltransferase, partial [Isosphaeraceae bacterium]|nr:phospholipid carrier-dependent glycosyltransferase [Isosphaeraceae bacterium]